jgi:hypothetical protein
MILPDKVQRPAFGPWRYEHNLNLAKTAELLEKAAAAIGLEGFTCSPEAVRRLCLPFNDPRRNEPSPDMLRAIGHLTGGEIGKGAFAAPVRTAA